MPLECSYLIGHPRTGDPRHPDPFLATPESADVRIFSRSQMPFVRQVPSSLRRNDEISLSFIPFSLMYPVSSQFEQLCVLQERPSGIHKGYDDSVQAVHEAKFQKVSSKKHPR